MPKPVKPGDKASITKTFTDDDVRAFAGISLDANPIHLDHDYAAASIFGQRVVHGMLVSSLFSGILGMQLPGEGTIALNISMSWKRPVFIGDEITATVEITNVREDKPIVTTKLTATNAKGEVVIEGEAVVKV
jgi:acyl dehydratase